jgi:hypothetical protein
VFHFKKYAHIKWSEIQEKKSEQAEFKKDTRYKFLWKKRVDTDNSLEDVIIRTEGKKHSLFNAFFRATFYNFSITHKPRIII